MFDGSPESCWNSDQGSPQYVTFDFLRNVQVTSIRVQFQGGFVGQEGCMEVGDTMAELRKVSDLDCIQDCNETQEFPLQAEGRFMRICFNASTDFYGRVTVYQLAVLGGSIEA